MHADDLAICNSTAREDDARYVGSFLVAAAILELLVFFGSRSRSHSRRPSCLRSSWVQVQVPVNRTQRRLRRQNLHCR